VSWLWISAPIAAVFFLGYTIIPIWLGFRRPDTGPPEAARAAAVRAAAVRQAASQRQAGTAGPQPATSAPASWPRAGAAVQQDRLAGARR
jgi:hypothetical protein